MKHAYAMTLAAALIFACSSSNKSTRTASSENPSGTTQPTSIEGTGSTAGTAASNTSGTTTPTNPQTATSGTGADTSAQGSVAQGTTGSPTSSGSTYGTAPSDTGSPTATNAPPSSSTGSTYGANTGTSGSVSGTSTDNFKTVTGAVAKIDQNSITFDQSAGGLTLTVDSNTQVLRRGQPIAAGISAIHEGEQVRASFDPASNRADKIEVMGHYKMRHHKGTSSTNPSDTTPPADNTAPSDNTNNPR